MKNNHWLRTLLCLLLVLCTVLALCACPASTNPPDGETPGGETPGGETPGGETGNPGGGGDNTGGGNGGGTGDGGEGGEGGETVLPDVDPVEGNPLYSEMWRPGYHFTSADSWINDPNGLTYFKGVYHVYYQKNPQVPNHGNLHWGHAVSTDLVHFEEVEPALFPDADGLMFSGTTYVDTENRSGLFDGVEGGGIIAAYSTHTNNIGVAYSTDGYVYEKLGIVLPNPGVNDFRDPKIFFDEISGKWTIVTAYQARFYQSDDLRTWREVSRNGLYGECPDFFPMKIEGTDTVKWVLTLGGREAYVGSWNGTKFTPESGKIVLNYGYDSYAGIIFSADKDNRTLMMGWIDSWYYHFPTEPDGQWSGALTLVNELKLYREGRNEYRITQTPIAEYEAIYEKELFSAPQVSGQDENPFASVNSQTYLLEFTIDLGYASDFKIRLYDSEQESVDLIYNAASKSLTLDRSKSVLGIALMKGEVIPDDGKNLAIQTMTFSTADIGGDGQIDVQVYVDTSSVEVYACGHTYVMTSRTQPMPTSRGLSLEADGELWLMNVKVTQLANIHFEDMTLVDPIYPETEIEARILGNNNWYNYFRVTKTAKLNVKDEDPTFYRIMTLTGRAITAESVDPSIATVEVTEGGILLRGLKAGETKIKVSTRYNYIYIPVKVEYDTGFNSQLGSFTTTNGTLAQKTDGYLFTPAGDGDAFALSETFASDFSYSADITFLENAGAAALLFRASDTNNFYCVSLDPANDSVKLWARHRGRTKDVAVETYDFNVEANSLYAVKIVAEGNSLAVYINGEEVLRATDSSHSNGYLGLNVYAEAAKFNHLAYKNLAK